jgi:hypothetical protein
VGFETDSGADQDSGAPTDTGTLSCVEVQVNAPADLLCETDLDCANVTTGYLCREELTCNCGGTAANRTAAARIASETAWIKFATFSGPRGVRRVSARSVGCRALKSRRAATRGGHRIADLPPSTPGFPFPTKGFGFLGCR